MKGTIPYIAWRERIKELTPENHRIDDDLILLDNIPYGEISKKPMKADATTAIFYEKGQATFSVNMKEYQVKAPSMVVFLPDSTYCPITESDDLQCKMLVMSKRFTEGLKERMHGTQQLFAVIFNNPVINLEEGFMAYCEYLSMLKSLMKSSLSPYRYEAALHLTLAMFYGHSVTSHQQSSGSSSTRQEFLYQRFIDLLQKHYRQERDVAFYADCLCVSPKYLSEVVRQTNGKGALAMIQECVITEAKALLYSTDMTVQEISDQLNFPSQSEFGKFFKRITGLSPKQYREQ